MSVLLLAGLWLVIGWLPTRVVKHWFILAFGPVLGVATWDWPSEVFSSLMALGGPANVAAVLIWRWDFGIKKEPWGWAW